MLSLLAACGAGTPASHDTGADAARPPAGLAVLGAVPDFALTDQSRATLRTADLRGKIWIADFIFTRCAGPCPAMTKSMALLQRRLPDVALVSFSCDPEHDQPDVLAQYAVDHGADTSRWRFLTGAWQDIARVAGPEGFKLTVAREGPGLVTHSSMFVLVDPEGQVRGYYDGTDANNVARLQADVARLRRQIAKADPDR